MCEFLDVFGQSSFRESYWLLNVHFLLLQWRWWYRVSFTTFFGSFFIVFLILFLKILFYQDWLTLQLWFSVKFIRVFLFNLEFFFSGFRFISWREFIFKHKDLQDFCNNFTKCNRRRQLLNNRLCKFFLSCNHNWWVWTFWCWTYWKILEA